MNKLTEWFRAQIGTREAGENNVIYNTRYYGREVSGSEYPWCVVFIWDGFREMGLSHLFCGGEKTAYCPYVMDWAGSHGLWVTDGYREGDLLLYDQDGDGTADHIGYCTQWSGSSGYAVEGNYGSAVSLVRRTAGEVLGAYRPAYPTDGGPSGVSELSSPRGSEGYAAREDEYTVEPGDTLWSIAERMMGDGSRWDELVAVNGLVSTVIYPGQRLRIPDVTYKTMSVTLKAELWEELLAAASLQEKTMEQVLEALIRR